MIDDGRSAHGAMCEAARRLAASNA